MTPHLCYMQDRVHTPYDYILYRFLYQLAWIAKFSLCSPSALLHLPSYIFPLTSSALRHQPSDISPQTSAFRHQPSDISLQTSAIRHQPSALRHQPSAIFHLPSERDTHPSPLYFPITVASAFPLAYYCYTNSSAFSAVG